MQRRMSGLMDDRLNCLGLTHAFLNSDAVLFEMEIPLGSALDILKSDRHGDDLFDHIKELVVPFHTGCQFTRTEHRNGISVCLADVKGAHRLECVYGYLHSFFHWFTVCSDHGIAVRIEPVLLHLLLVRGRGHYADPLLSLLHESVHFLPAGERLAHGRVRSLQHDQDLVVHGIPRELRTKIKVILVILALEDIFHALLKLHGHLIHFSLSGFSCSLRIKRALVKISLITIHTQSSLESIMLSNISHTLKGSISISTSPSVDVSTR